LLLIEMQVGPSPLRSYASCCVCAHQLTLNKVVSTPGLDCREGDNFRFHDAAITLSGTNVTMADVSATWNAEATAFTTSGNEVLKVDGTKTPPTLTLMKVSVGMEDEDKQQASW
jgi:hypothetical protein